MSVETDRLYSARATAMEAHARAVDEKRRLEELLKWQRISLGQLEPQVRDLREKISQEESRISLIDRDLPRLAQEDDRALRAYNEAREREKRAASPGPHSGYETASRGDFERAFGPHARRNR